MTKSYQPAYDDYLAKLKKILAAVQDDRSLYEAIVNAPFSDKAQSIKLGLGVVVLLLVNEATKTIDRIALSNTEAAKGAVEYSVKDFKAIKIPVNYEANIIARAISTGNAQQTADWKYMFIPALTAEEARFNQAGAGIGCSIVYPLIGARDGGAMIFSYYVQPEEISETHQSFMRRYSAIVADFLKV